jgi:hypothetical protein
LVVYDACGRTVRLAGGDGQGVAPEGITAPADRLFARKPNENRFPCMSKTGQ